MQSPGSRLLFVCIAAILAIPAGAATPAFTITATNITMPSGGNVGSSQFTLASVGGYAGQVRVDCAYSGSSMGAKVPSCGVFVNPVSTLKADQTASGTLTLVPYGKTIGYGSASIRERARSGVPILAASALGFFLLGRRLRIRSRSWLLLLALSAITIVGMSACAAGMSGTFPYTVTAVDIKTNTTVTAPFTVTVP